MSRLADKVLNRFGYYRITILPKEEPKVIVKEIITSSGCHFCGNPNASDVNGWMVCVRCKLVKLQCQ